MPRPPKLWFLLLTFVNYLGQIEFETAGPGTRVNATGYTVPSVHKPANAANH